jgi:hypothetical protein
VGVANPLIQTVMYNFAETESDGVCVKMTLSPLPGLWNTDCGFIAAPFRTCDRVSESLDKEVVFVEEMKVMLAAHPPHSV